MLPQSVYYHLEVAVVPDWEQAARTAAEFHAGCFGSYMDAMMSFDLPEVAREVMVEDLDAGKFRGGADLLLREQIVQVVREDLQAALATVKTSVEERRDFRQTHYPDTPYLLWDYDSTERPLVIALSRLDAAGVLTPLGIQRGYPEELKTGSILWKS
jgi:hypothetical protein